MSKTLMTYLYEKYMEYCADKETDDHFTDFIQWASKYLAEENPPVNVMYPGVGIGLRLRSGDFVTFSPQDEHGLEHDNSIPITRHNANLIPASSIHITGR